jgi:hypothetical protein
VSSVTKNPPRPWSRITIRTSMLIVLGIAALLSWQVNKAREQRQAVAAIQRFGGWVAYDYEFVNGELIPGRNPWAPVWLRKQLGDEFFQTVRYVDLFYDYSSGKPMNSFNMPPCDDFLRQLLKLDGLTGLTVHAPQVTDGGLRHIGKLTGLEELYIGNARSITDARVSHLAGLNKLRSIHINCSNLTDNSLAILSSLPSMETLSLQDNHFSDKGLERLGRKPHLKQLFIGLGDSHVTDAGLLHLRTCEKLYVLDLQSSKVTAQGLEVLKGLPNLTTLWLGAIGLSDAQIEALRAAMPNVQIRLEAVGTS